MAKRQFKTGAQDLHRPQITTIPLRFTYEPEALPMKISRRPSYHRFAPQRCVIARG